MLFLVLQWSYQPPVYVPHYGAAPHAYMFGSRKRATLRYFEGWHPTVLSVVIPTDHEGVQTYTNSCCGAHTNRLNMYIAVLILMVVQHLTRWKQDPGSEQPFEILRDDTPLF